MSKLSVDKIKEELEGKKYTLINADNYETLETPILIQCEKGHQIKVSMKDFRRPSFICPCCDKSISFINPKIIPEKKGYRVIAFDQATEKFGLSIWEDGQLIFYQLYNFSGDLISRLVKIKKFISEIVIDAWKPDYIVFEDIQQQHGAVITYKVLAMLIGVIQVTCAEKGVSFDIVFPNVWRKKFGTCGKTRREEKLLSIAVVKEKFNIDVSDDIAEAILIGKYGSQIHTNLSFGNKK